MPYLRFIVPGCSAALEMEAFGAKAQLMRGGGM
jgi:hypothetical protein